MPINAWFLVGPTAVGKTAVIQHLAEQMGATVISADSMLVYRDMDIGTAKPSPTERGSVPYWGLDCVAPDTAFSVGDYLCTMQEHLARTQSPPERILVTGGTGLYVDCLIRGLTSRPAADPALRAELEQLFQQEGVAGLQHRLSAEAPGRLEELADPRNPRRLIRAIELARQGVTAQAMLARTRERPALVGLDMPTDELQIRITRRVHQMYDQGLLQEAAELRARYPVLSKTARQAIGYAEAWAHIDGICTRTQAQQATILRTRQLAKRQRTWFRHQAEMTWVEARAETSVADMAQAVQAQWERHGPTPLFL